MSLILLSQKIESRKETLANIVLASVKANLRLVINQNSVTALNAIEIYIDRNYGKVSTEELEYFLLDVHSEEYIKKQNEMELSSFEINSLMYYGLAGTDQAEYDHLIYDFALAYLRLKPEHCISLYGETFFFLEDMEKLESEGGYYKDWCYTPAS